MEDTKFYSKKDGQKFDMCKQCLTMHVDNFDPDTFLWILKELDVPWVPYFWNKIRDRQYTKHNGKLKGTSVIGKYLSQVKLKQYKNYTWETSQDLQKEVSRKNKVDEEAAMVLQQQYKQQFEKGQINQAQFRTLTSTQFQKQNEYVTSSHSVPSLDEAIGKNNAFNENDFLPQE